VRIAGAVLLGLLALAGSVEAQGRPFVFTVTSQTPSASERWSVQYEVGYADRTAAPFGYDGLEQRSRIQGSLGRGFTLLGQIGLGVGEDATNSTQEIEVLKDLLAAGRPVALAAGLGARREWDGGTVLTGRAVVGHAFERSALFGNVRLEKPLAEGRDALDLITSLGWLHRIGPGLHAGVEALGEDLEGFWDAEEAEGGAKLFIGPSIHFAPSRKRVFASLCGGPIVYATRNDRSSPAARPLGASGNGYSLRLAMGYRF
jgi:hypothetical protein